MKCIFKIQYEEVFYIQRPSEDDRRKFFQQLVLNEASMPPPRRRKTGKLIHSKIQNECNILVDSCTV